MVVKNTGEEGPEENDITIFNPSDEASYSNALILANELRKKKQFTDVNRFALICGTCMEGFVGQREAVEHSKTTGHTNFQQTS